MKALLFTDLFQSIQNEAFSNTKRKIFIRMLTFMTTWVVGVLIFTVFLHFAIVLIHGCVKVWPGQKVLAICVSSLFTRILPF